MMTNPGDSRQSGASEIPRRSPQVSLTPRWSSVRTQPKLVTFGWSARLSPRRR